ncbi:MAG: hypothetical protein ACRDGQ_09665 [Candidatus Limnocylindrales bacterium]
MARFHADIHILSSAPTDPVGGAGTMSGGILLFDPQGTGILVRKVMISTDTSMRIVVGPSDQDNQRIRAGYFAQNGGAAPDTCWEGVGKIFVFHPSAGNIDVAIDGEYL